MMKGLLIKDYKLMKNQRNFLLLITVIGLMIGISNDSLIGGISYIIFLVTFSSLSNLSYDEADNCMQFLMTLPAGRKLYVQEKYIFAINNSLATWLVLTAGSSFLEFYRGKNTELIKELFFSTLILVLLSWIVFSIYLPVQLKFGSDKSRIVLAIICGGTAAFVFLFGKDGFADHFSGIKEFFLGMNEYTATGITAGITLIGMYISYLLSKKIVMEKEF